MVELDFGGVKENVVTQKEFTVEQAQNVLQNEVIATLGYGIQGRSQALNMRDQGIKVIVGQRPGSKTWELAVKDGWVPDVSLFTVEEAAKRGTIKMFLLTDAGQKEEWSQVKKSLKAGDALYVSHGFSVVFKEQTGVVPPADIDVILVAPKGSGTSVRRNFLDGSGINSSFAIFQNATGRAEERAKAMGIAIGSGYLFPTTFEKETFSDLTGERGTLMGALAGIIEAQYATLREHGHSPSEAFNETVEELTQSLIRLVDENGMDWMYNNCSETARIGALRWKERFRSATKPVFESLYELTAAGEESRIVLERSKEANYKQKLADELKAMGNSELWRTGAIVRSLRPSNQKKE
ncbi:MAG: ketol-acid reductoisomerase [Candidatus Bathyarchaeota archaeon]|nr:ketol-acid reductoisomerase [Candidatus Termiticorpusculum sp.]MCL1970817.1 ketol-acid reductoisomerase [Candidatus Termiticorpusculum sp.]